MHHHNLRITSNLYYIYARKFDIVKSQNDKPTGRETTHLHMHNKPQINMDKVAIVIIVVTTTDMLLYYIDHLLAILIH